MSSLRGLFRTRGYGYVIAITDEGFTVYDVTSERCTENLVGPVGAIDDLVSGANIRVDDPTRARMRVAGAIKYIELTSIVELPGLCADVGRSRDPEHNFEVLWQTFEEQYAFFAERGVDWRATYDRLRPMVTATTTDEALLAVFADMIGSLHDGHVHLSSDDTDVYSIRSSRLFDALTAELPAYPEYENVFELVYAREEQHLAMLRARYLHGEVNTGAHGKLLWGHLREDVGYLEVRSMSGFAGEDAPLDREWAALDEALDEALTALQGVEQLVVDVRFDHGGYDYAQGLIAGRFADQTRLAFSTSVRDGDRPSPEQLVYVEPRGHVRFEKPVVLLVSPLTVSAAEIFVLSMRVLPNVTVVGEATAGQLSDTLPKRLPNGWDFNLSTERYVAADGYCYEALGIPPDVEILFWRPEDVANEVDPMLEHVLSTE